MIKTWNICFLIKLLPSNFSVQVKDACYFCSWLYQAPNWVLWGAKHPRGKPYIAIQLIVGQMWNIKKVFPTTFYFTPYILTKISVHAYPYFLLKKLGLLLKFLFIWSFLFCIISCHLPKITRQISTHHCILSMADIARRKDGNRWRRRRERGEKAR